MCVLLAGSCRGDIIIGDQSGGSGHLHNILFNDPLGIGLQNIGNPTIYAASQEGIVLKITSTDATPKTLMGNGSGGGGQVNISAIDNATSQNHVPYRGVMIQPDNTFAVGFQQTEILFNVIATVDGRLEILVEGTINGIPGNSLLFDDPSINDELDLGASGQNFIRLTATGGDSIDRLTLTAFSESGAGDEIIDRIGHIRIGGTITDSPPGESTVVPEATSVLVWIVSGLGLLPSRRKTKR